MVPSVSTDADIEVGFGRASMVSMAFAISRPGVLSDGQDLGSVFSTFGLASFLSACIELHMSIGGSDVMVVRADGTSGTSECSQQSFPRKYTDFLVLSNPAAHRPCQ